MYSRTLGLVRLQQQHLGLNLEPVRPVWEPRPLSSPDTSQDKHDVFLLECNSPALFSWSVDTPAPLHQHNASQNKVVLTPGTHCKAAPHFPLGPASICCRASSLTGLGAKVVNAQIETLEDGTARDKFWITDRMNKKVSVWFCNQLWSVRSLCSVHASATPCRSGWPSVMWSQASRDSQWC